MRIKSFQSLMYDEAANMATSMISSDRFVMYTSVMIELDRRVIKEVPGFELFMMTNAID